MKIILFMSMSINGFIARENHDEDFLSEDNYKTFVELANDAGAAIWGRKTHETIRSYGKEAFEKIKKVKKMVVSKNKDFEIEENCEIANSPAEAINKLENMGFKKAILTGGSMLNASFAKEKLIDEIIINIQSVIVGKGIALFEAENFDMDLKLEKIKKISSEIVQLRYSINN